MNFRSKRKRRGKAAVHGTEGPVLPRRQELWNMNFVADQLIDGQRFRALTLVDNVGRGCLEMEIGQSLKGFDVVDVM